MTEQLVDQQSRQRIKADLTRNQLVEAGAGSGKTQMMAERMAAGVASGVYEVPQMAAVTFTRKAAAELRGRFQLALEAELTKSASDGARTDRLRDALSNIERFFAGTIHSFCAHLLRERPVEAGVSPGFTELDEVEDTRLRRQSWRDYRTQLKAAGDPLMLDLMEAGLKASDLDRAFDTVCLYEEVEFPPGDATMPDPAQAWQALDLFWAALQKDLPVPFQPDSTCNIQKRAHKFRGQLRVTSSHRKAPVDLVPLLETWDCESRIVQIRWSDDAKTKKRIAKEVQDLHEAFRRETVQPFLQQWRQYVYRLSISVLTKAREHAREERRRVNTLNYGDLLQLAAKVLRENVTVRTALGEKYRWLFVDEFQDTDPVQAEIMFLLAADNSVATASDKTTDWRAVTLWPGALFVVGDPKQSIYRFRRADIDIYNDVRARLQAASNGDVLPLTSNFRSVAALCEWANTVFAGQFPTEPTLHSPKYARLEPVDRKPVGASGLFTLSVPATVEKSDIASFESEAIARYIHAEVGAKRRKYGDFLILTRKRKDLEVYADALERLHIPAEVSGAGAFGDSDEVRQLALLLHALADPQDAVSLVGVLRGPLFGISDRDLFSYRQAGGWFSVFAEAPTQAPAGARRVASALSSLRLMHRWTQILPVGAAVERILEDSGYLALAATTPGGVEAGDLLHAVDRVRSIVETGHTLADAADALEPDADESSEVESLSLEPGRTDVVRVMNLHKAKGLEAPVVFLANPLSGVKPRVDARIIRDGLHARGYFKIKDGREFGQRTLGEPDGWAQYEAEELAYLEAEEKRLLYVAATRAKDLLVIGRWAGKTSTSGPWKVFDGFMQTAIELPLPGSATLAAPEFVDLSSTAALAAAERARTAHQRALKPSWSSASVTTETKAFPKLVPEVEADADDPTRVVSDSTPSRRADAGAAWGSLIHGLLEHALRHHNVTAVDLRRLAMWLTVDEPTLRPFLDDAVSTVQAVAKSEFWAEANASPECHQEVPFSILVTDADGVTPKILNGTIDSVFRTADGWKIVDYKTDLDGSPEILQARYGKQLAAYEDAWRRFTADAVTSSIVPARTKTLEGE